MITVSPSTGRPQLMSRAIAEDIGTRILSGEYPSGTLLIPEVLLAAYMVSRTCLREAITLLISKGLIAAKPNQGTVVTQVAEWNLLDPQILSWAPADGWLAESARRLFDVLSLSEGLMFSHVAGDPLSVHLMRALAAVPASPEEPR